MAEGGGTPIALDDELRHSTGNQARVPSGCFSSCFVFLKASPRRYFYTCFDFLSSWWVVRELLRCFGAKGAWRVSKGGSRGEKGNMREEMGPGRVAGHGCKYSRQGGCIG